MNGIVIVGPPGSGKSMIGKSIANTLDMVYVSSGDVARNMAKHDEKVCNALNCGSMAPEVKMRNEIYGLLYNINYHNKEFVLDGFPRFKGQLDWLKEKFPSILVVSVDVPPKVCINRMLSRERSDDNKDAVIRRINYYYEHTLPMIERIHDRIDIDNNCAVSAISGNMLDLSFAIKRRRIYAESSKV